jgi:hypothetical protein
VNCDALQILIDIQKQGREEAAQQFLEPLRKVNPIEFDKLIAKNDTRRWMLVRRARWTVGCRPIRGRLRTRSGRRRRTTRTRLPPSARRPRRPPMCIAKRSSGSGQGPIVAMCVLRCFRPRRRCRSDL